MVRAGATDSRDTDTSMVERSQAAENLGKCGQETRHEEGQEDSGYIHCTVHAAGNVCEGQQLNWMIISCMFAASLICGSWCTSNVSLKTCGVW